MPKKITTTVGTSIFTNYYAEMREKKQEGEASAEYETLRKRSHSLWGRYADEEIPHLRGVISAWANGNDQASAEIASLLKIADTYKDEELEVYLIATDTVLSRLAAELVREWFGENNVPNLSFAQDKKYEEKGCFVVEGLTVEQPESFRASLKDLIKEFNRIRAGVYKEGDVLLNITGGYKGLIPYLTIYGQISRTPIVYLYEDTNQLITIPQAPIGLDWNFIADQAHLFRQFSEGSMIHRDEWERWKGAYDFPAEMLDYVEMVAEGDDLLISLNEVGTVAWEEFGNYFFVQIPYASKYFKENPSDKLTVNGAILELRRRLDSVLQGDKRFVDIHDGDIKHTKVGNAWIYKQSNPKQIRLLYEFDQATGKLIVFSYHFVTSDADDKDSTRGYEPVLKRSYEHFKNLKEEEFQTLGFRKV